MDRHHEFVILKWHATLKLIGYFSTEEAEEAVLSAIELMREKEIQRLLLDITQTTGFPPPTVAERYFLVQRLAQAARGELCIAVVARPEIIDPDKITLIAARNNRLNADIFSSEQEALAWLEQAQPFGSPARSRF